MMSSPASHAVVGKVFFSLKISPLDGNAHLVKKDLNKKLDPKQKTIQAFNIDA